MSCFLYAGAAEKRRPVGTGFFVSLGVSSPKYRYLVTAKHIVEGVHRNGERLSARVNLLGAPEMLLHAEAMGECKRLEDAGEHPNFFRLLDDLYEKPPARFVHKAEAMLRIKPSLADGSRFEDLGGADNWIFHEDKVDIDVLDWQPPPEADIIPFQLKWAATPDFIKREHIGPGDDVFVAGLFQLHTGKERNIPIIRVGNLAATPEEPIKTATGLQEAYLVELRSIAGLSGSPVFIYLGGLRREFPPVGEFKLLPHAGSTHLLSLLLGHRDVGAEEKVESARDALDSKERINTGIAAVVPIARLLEILDYPDVRDAREKRVPARGELSQQR